MAAGQDADPDSKLQRTPNIAAPPVIAPTLGATSSDSADPEPAPVESRARWLGYAPPWLLSTLAHIAVFLLLALFTLQHSESPPPNLALNANSDPSDLHDAGNRTPELQTSASDAGAIPFAITPSELPPSIPLDQPGGPPLTPAVPEFNTQFSTTPGSGGGDPNGFPGSFGQRNGPGRGNAIGPGGASSGSEDAVRLALQWLANHQFPDGHWSLDHRNAPQCHGQCSAPGLFSTTRPDCPFAATAMGVLPFLGAGITQNEGEHKAVVDRALHYLVANQQPDGSWHEFDGQTSIYAQGLCTIALCEAFAMTHDMQLRKPAQLAIDYLVKYQDKSGGGWKYTPGMPGDTSVTGWQLMALKSAQLARLQVPESSFRLADAFFNSVAREKGAFYGYEQPGAAKTTTAVGLLCRMYLGWPHDHPPLVEGVQFLAHTGPDSIANDAYYNYYATQVLRHYGGPLWLAWNDELRDKLVQMQSTTGHAAGSWYTDANYNKSGGRHYVTALSCMTLEVYYRYMPLYSEASSQAIDVDGAFQPGSVGKDAGGK